ncbi:tyrosine-protein phosphatase [Sphingobium aromaticiconvertens]|uniref:tyrosine-protein phosphatase n=1 Tax=Sphingobium aromaticiconvertens TaxID=365341 RepID=UPI003017F553
MMTRMMIRAAALTSLPLVAMLAGPAALAGTITDPIVERVSPDRLVVRWKDADAVDVLQADGADTAAGSATLVSAKDKDGVHEVQVRGTARPYFLLRDTRSGDVVRVAERVLPLEQGSNFRDVGGYAAAGGKHVRWGMIYRSGGQPMLTDADVQEVKGLRIANLVDLRSDEERVIAPTRLDGIPYNAVGYSMAGILASMAQGAKGGPTDPAKAMEGMANGYRAFSTLSAVSTNGTDLRL